MTIRDALSELKVSLFLLGVSIAGLGIATYFTYTAGPPGSNHCLAFRATGFFCGSDYVAFGWVAAVFTVICSIAASVLAVLEGLDAFREEKRVDYVVATVCLFPLAALVAISITAS
jgi:hypothetical protein